MANEITKIVTYQASSFASLDSLKDTCQTDEGRLGQIIKIESGLIDKSTGARATQITYQRVTLPTDINISKLIFAPFGSEAEANTIDAQHQLAKDPPLVSGSQPRAVAFIGANTVNFLAYRQHK